ncbi:DUF4255 domain-containing protein [Rivularia sp. UHCC 0363]|uniref:DUF4255 domain-containing protein n=1 Tax=Rivularia sp. UHCC 0363 TaxID=3110244 RepID=UPI002B200973|nr:DUF4255 domain-containing protein [Rivularia sp. UHCC 0363]MEA5593301.1 DUF4255 domain-containing protein [Rivularia sp. UHCC 0363]
MSNSLAIAAVTTTLRNIIARGIGDELGSGSVTTRPPDKARENGEGSNQINVFLYQTLPNSALRNQDIPNRVKPGETGKLPLALNLYYLITAYGQDYDDILSHRLLGTAMRVLHDRAILKPEDIKAALAQSNLHQQIERIRITPQSLSLDDVSKLWTTFQTQYRISAAYEVSVILIDSSLPVKAPLPVLTRGSDDIGVIAQADLIPPFPTLETLQLPQQFSVRLGEVLSLQGHDLNSDDGNVLVLLKHKSLDINIELELQQQTSAKEINIQIPDERANLPSGFYTVAVKLQREGKEQTTNALPFSLAPKIEQIATSNQTLTINFNPQLWQDQEISLFLGDRQLLPIEEQTGTRVKTNTINFNAEKIPPGEYFVRLRVDGVDSLLVDNSVKPPVFDSSQKVTLP